LSCWRLAISAGADAAPSFDDFYRAATGREPGEPDSRAGTVLAWLWHRLHGSEVVAAATPRRLVYVLPQGSVAELVAARVGEWLARLSLADQVGLHVVPGSSGSEEPQWRRDMHRPAIVIGCADYLVSKALNRGYGISGAMWPIDFALVTNGAQWVFDDIERCGLAAETVRELAAAAAEPGTAEPLAVTCLPAVRPGGRRLDATPGDYPAIAAAVAAAQQPGMRTLVVLESVAAARSVYSALPDAAGPRVLIHSQFRGRERQALAAALVGDPGDSGQIVVATRAAQAGIDSAVVFTEPTAPPAAQAATEGPALPGATDLFDAAAPVASYLDSPADLEAQLIWATWTSADGRRPPQDARLPTDEWRCRAAIPQIDALAGRASIWRIDRAEGSWTALTPEEPAGPGEILLVAAADGGYDPALGFDPGIGAAVDDSPSIDPIPAASAGGRWVSLLQHSEETRDQAVALLAATRPQLASSAIRAVECAAYLHDVGKAHPIWQDALCALASDANRATIDGGRPWAKSGVEAPLEFAGAVSFRHELASLLLIDGPLRGLIDEHADRDLVRYLVLAHHGQLRLWVGDGESAVIHGLAHGATWPMPTILGQPTVQLAVDLAQFDRRSGLRPAWTSTVGRLLERYGPFTLAYLEMIVRVADWRSSGGEPLALPSRRGG
jgi:CRISPR-associated endonuclease Cas3-HD